MQSRRQDNGSYVMSLAPEVGAGIDLTLNNELLHSLAELLHNAMQVAQWDLPALIDGQAPAQSNDATTIN